MQKVVVLIVAVGCSFLIVQERSLNHAAVHSLTAKLFLGSRCCPAHSEQSLQVV